MEVSEKVKSFFARYPQKHYQKGELLVQVNENPLGIFYLEEGVVKKYTMSLNGESIILNLYRPSAFFPMSWAINSTPNEYFYEAVDEVRLRICPKDDGVQFVKDNPDVLFDLLSRVYKGTDGMLTRMSYLLAQNKYASVITEILIYAKRFGKTINNNGFEVSLNQQDIASQAGMVRETVSREMQVLKDKGLISFEHHILTIPNSLLLEEELHQNT
jgi:CRP-like cAMP-binding protein